MPSIRCAATPDRCAAITPDRRHGRARCAATAVAGRDRRSDCVPGHLGNVRQPLSAAGRRASAVPGGSPGPGRSRPRAAWRRRHRSRRPPPTTCSDRLWPRSTMDRTIAAWAGLASMSDDEALVDLELVDGQRRQVPERRLADAEVVEAHPHADGVELCQHRRGAGRVGEQGRLGDLDDEALGRDAEIGEDVDDLARRIGPDRGCGPTRSPTPPRRPRSRMSVNALRMTHVVSLSMRSVCSHMGMKRSG